MLPSVPCSGLGQSQPLTPPGCPHAGPCSGLSCRLSVSPACLSVLALTLSVLPGGLIGSSRVLCSDLVPAVSGESSDEEGACPRSLGAQGRKSSGCRPDTCRPVLWGLTLHPHPPVFQVARCHLPGTPPLPGTVSHLRAGFPAVVLGCTHVLCGASVPPVGWVTTGLGFRQVHRAPVLAVPGSWCWGGGDVPLTLTLCSAAPASAPAHQPVQPSQTWAPAFGAAHPLRALGGWGSGGVLPGVCPQSQALPGLPPAEAHPACAPGQSG